MQNKKGKLVKICKNVLTKIKLHIIITIVVSKKPVQNIKCRCGGTGRRTGLKILRMNNPCRFDSGHLHQLGLKVNSWGGKL